MADKRKYPRYDISLNADLIIKDLQGTFSGTAKDFSRSGVRIVLEHAIPSKGQEVQLCLRLAEHPQPVMVTGVVAWAQASDKRHQAGIEIKEIDKSVKSEILDRAFQAWRLKQKDVDAKTF